MLSLLTKKKCVFTVHSTVFTDKKAPIAGLVEKILLSKIKIDLEIAVSNNFIGKFKNKNKIVYIPNGVDIAKFNLPKKQAHDGKFTVLFVGRLVGEKGLEYLIDAMEILEKEKADKIQLKIVGEGDLYPRMLQKVQEKNMGEKISFLGKKEGAALIEEYVNADLFVLPSLSEGFPLVLIEAMAAKLPVVATNVGMNSQIILHGKNGFIVESHDLRALADAILRASRMSVEELMKMGEEGYAMVKENYTWDIVTDKTRREYVELLQKN
jgi:glycosyltransferase involved in cell wall biosynthesis